ncbi:MAG: type II secretory pathway component PulF [Planctomycetota bacterium]
MKFFNYRAIADNGGLVTGETAALSELYLDADLEQRGLLLTRAREVKPRQLSARARLSRSELLQLTSTLATLYGAGVPLVDGLRSFKERTPSPRLTTLLSEMLIQLEEGASLSEVIEGKPMAFPSVFHASIAAGEASGSLDEVLARLVKHMEWSEAMRATTMQALIYPTILLAAVGVLIGILLFHVLPSIVTMFPGGAADLPQETQAVLAFSSFFTERAALLLVPIALCTLALLLVPRVSSLRFGAHRLMLELPWFGTMASKIAISKFAATAAILKRSGCDVITLIRVSAKASGNVAIEKAFERCGERVKSGQSFSKAMQAEALIDPMLIEVTHIGECSGELGPALARMSEHYEREVPRSVRNTLAIFEPALLISAGAVVAFVLLAAMLPILDLYDKLG